jgi:hypothetical protein
MAEKINSVIDSIAITDSDASITSESETPIDTPIDLEKTPEFEVWKKSKLEETAEYLINTWDIHNAELVMMPMYTFPDRNNRRAYGSVSSGQSFVDPDGKILVNPATKLPMSYAVWRKIPPSAEPEIEDTKSETEPTAIQQPAA